jgi:ectoine hydroxylase-related dioxygenase (phytanoyl-CoA dioxygenase family)
MNKYTENKHAMNIPWIESPFFYQLLDNSELTKKEKEQCIFYHEKGYLIIDLALDEVFIEEINYDVGSILSGGSFTDQKIYEYTERSRLFELWKKSSAVRKLATNQTMMNTLKMLYARESFPFGTINFTNPTSQPLHSDTIHFNSYPAKWMVGTWIALEDCDYSNGTLRMVPGSHRWEEYDYHNMKIPHPDTRDNGEQLSYKEYDAFIEKLVIAKGAKTISPDVKKGQAILWASNLLHGGTPVTDASVSRKAQAVHYFFKGCKKYYTPMFSEPMKNIYADKWCNSECNILNYSGE